MATTLVPPLLYVAATLLVASGVSKFRDPAAARLAVLALRLPAERLIVAGLAGGEIASGVLALVRPAWASPLLGAIYFAFALLADRLRRLGVASCGCLGSTSAPPSRLHSLICLLLAAAAVTASLQQPPSLTSLLMHAPLLALPELVGLLAATALVAATINELPQLVTAYGRPPR